jgi:hypothetical protein
LIVTLSAVAPTNTWSAAALAWEELGCAYDAGYRPVTERI